MITEMANPARRSALVLHALCENDREWILQRLPAANREMLRNLLGELAELGIPSDPSLVAPFEAVGGAANGRDTGAVRSLCAKVARLEPEQLAPVLRDEPPQLIAAFVQLYAWPWRDAFIQQLGPLRRKQVLDLLAAEAIKVPPALERPAHALLLSTIIERAGALPPSGASRDRRALSRGLLGSAAQWLRKKGLS